jgi:hypothetical protein
MTGGNSLVLKYQANNLLKEVLPCDPVPIALLLRLAYRFWPVWPNGAGSVALMPQNETGLFKPEAA